MQDNAATLPQKSIAEELYAKNVELVNANKALELLQELYEIIINNIDLKSISNLFINKIVSEMGFTDGLVFLKEDTQDKLKLAGLTQTEINKTVLEIFNLSSESVYLDLSSDENAFVKSFKTNQSIVTTDLANNWTPFIKPSDLASIQTLNRKNFIFPITFGIKILGAFSVSIDSKFTDLTEFEVNVLSRVKTVFGIAVERVKTSQMLEKAQERELEKAREVIKLKDEFVFIATHDLRTPVTAISGFVDLIETERNSLPENIKDDFEAIKEASGRLHELVDDLLEVARSESGTIQIQPEPVNIEEIVKHVVNEVTPSAAQRNIQLQVNLAEQKTVMADAEKLQEVVENLFSNAVKYNRDNGQVKFETRIENNNLVFEISDTGLGIPANVQDKIFTKFFRARQKGTETVPGTGLGLFVVRMLIEKMKGNITFKSVEGQGTIFTFKLPVVPKMPVV